MLSFSDFHKTKAIQVEAALDRCLAPINIEPCYLHKAMRYSTLNGGKRIRALLCYATAYLIGIKSPVIDNLASSVELIHAYSLIHDDLPAMDDDDLRRGKPSCHKAFDEATAILAGDALQALAFKVIADCDYSATHKIHALSELAHASSSRGMVGGQAIDLSFIKQDISIAELENMHIHKTGALICASVTMCAGLAYNKDDIDYKSLKHFAECVGLAFQVQDDILDESASTELLGKTTGKDKLAGKPTYASLLGLKGAKQFANDLYDDAIKSLSHFDHRADYLREIAKFTITRQS